MVEVDKEIKKEIDKLEGHLNHLDYQIEILQEQMANLYTMVGGMVIHD